MTDAETASLQAKRDEVVAHIDSCLTLAPDDSVRALAEIDEARKVLQSLWCRIYDVHLVSGAKHRPQGVNHG